MRASIILLSYNQLNEATIPCIESIYKNTNINDFELIVVDNNSQDKTQEYLQGLEMRYSNVKICLNDVNKGYAAGNNDGLRVSEGNCIVLLNNDTLVTNGWLDSLLYYIENDLSIGIIGPISNSVGNEQRVDIKGLNDNNYELLSRKYINKNKTVIFETKKLGFFCVAFRRDVFEKVGFLDEEFGIGMLEDDDYCMRVAALGYKIAVTEGCFIFHKGSVSFNKITYDEYHELLNRNKLIFLSKHKVEWLLSDLAFSYLDKFESDFQQYENSTKEIDVNIERITLRLRSFRELLLQLRIIEAKRLNISEQYISDSKRIVQTKWDLRKRNFQRQFISGTYKQKKAYLKQIIKKLFYKLNKSNLNDVNIDENAYVIKKFVEIRKKIKFKKVIVLPATVDYSYMTQRPQQIATALTEKGYLVIYATLNCQSDNVTIIEKISKNLYVLNERFFPLLSHLATKEETIYYCMWPTNLKHLDYLSFDKMVYDYMDEIELLFGDQDELVRNHNTLMEKTDIITVSATKLLANIPEKYKKKTLLITNGVSDRFLRLIKNAKVDTYIKNIKDSGKMVIGYYGAVATWFDFELIDFLASNVKSADFVFIGPVFDVQEKINNTCEKHNNLHFLKEKQHEELVNYLKGFDICIIPFIINDITNAVSPVKLFEYMASGHPIVTTDLAECYKYKSVLISKNNQEFLSNIHKASKFVEDKEYINLLKYEANENTWSLKMNKVLDSIQS